jgi:hypothetical protein
MTEEVFFSSFRSHETFLFGFAATFPIGKLPPYYRQHVEWIHRIFFIIAASSAVPILKV